MDISFSIQLYRVPADELEQDINSICCDECSSSMPVDAEEILWDGDEGFYCEACEDKVIEGWKQEADNYAIEQSKITKPLIRFRPEYEYKCSPLEYSEGCKESYSQNSVMCHNRHNCTNYDYLISGLKKGVIMDDIFYNAIRDRIEYLIESAEPSQYSND